MKKRSKLESKWIEEFNKEQLAGYPELADETNQTTLGEYKDSWTYEISLEYYLKGRHAQLKKPWLLVLWEVFTGIVILLLIVMVLSQSYMITKLSSIITEYEDAYVQFVIDSSK